MIPQNVYDHVRYGTGARPEASHENSRGVLYFLYYKDRRVRCKRYPADFLSNYDARVDVIRLGQVPETVEADWETGWTHET